MKNHKWKIRLFLEQAFSQTMFHFPFQISHLPFVFLVALSILVPSTQAQHLPTDARASVIGSRVPFPSSTDFSLWHRNSAEDFPSSTFSLWHRNSAEDFPSSTDFSLWHRNSAEDHRLKSVLPAATVERVGPIGMTVSDVDRAIEFYTKVLSFEKVSDTEVTGEDYEQLQGVFGLRMRVVRMRLGEDFIELT